VTVTQAPVMIANGATVLPKHKSGEPLVRESHRNEADSQAEGEERRAGSDWRKFACGLEVGRWKEVDDFHHNDGVEERGRVSEQSRAAPENVERNCRVSNERTLDEKAMMPAMPRMSGASTRPELQAYVLPPHVRASTREVTAATKIILLSESTRSQREFRRL
jgi:hypothetical protein